MWQCEDCEGGRTEWLREVENCFSCHITYKTNSFFRGVEHRAYHITPHTRDAALPDSKEKMGSIRHAMTLIHPRFRLTNNKKVLLWNKRKHCHHNHKKPRERVEEREAVALLEADTSFLNSLKYASATVVVFWCEWQPVTSECYRSKKVFVNEWHEMLPNRKLFSTEEGYYSTFFGTEVFFH